MSVVDLSDDEMYMIALRLPLDDLANICRADHHMNQITCARDGFWKARTELEFGVVVDRPPGIASWSEFYRYLKAPWTLIKSSNLSSYSIKNIGLPTGDAVISLAMHVGTVLMVSQTGQVWATGLAAGLPITNEPLMYIDTPIRVVGTEDITAVSIAVGHDFAYILDVDGILWSLGEDGRDGELGRTGDNSVGRTEGIDKKIVSMGCSYSYGLAVDEHGGVWGAGKVPGFGGQYMNNRFLPLDLPFKVDKISCGNSHTLFIDTDRNLWGIGNTISGQLGYYDVHDVTVPVLIPVVDVVAVSTGYVYSNVALDIHGGVWTWGGVDRGYTGPTPTEIFKNAVKVACSSKDIYVIDIYGNVWGAGSVYDTRRGMIYHHTLTNLNMKAMDLVVQGDDVAYKGLRM